MRGIACKLIFAALVITGAACCAGNEQGRRIEGGRGVLAIRNSASRAVYGTWPLEDNGEFAVEFVHSVNQTPVREFFRIEDERDSFRMIRPFAVRFYSFGAGMQSDVEEGQTLSRDGDAMVLSGSFRAQKELNYIVGTVSDHLLLINGETISLRKLCGRNAHITIYAE